MVEEKSCVPLYLAASRSGSDANAIVQLPLTSRPSMLAFMNASAQQLLKDAMALPETERADLAYELLASLPTPEPRSPRSDREWIAEIERRAHRAVAGDTGVSWSEARSQIEDRLRGR